jgi:hypothetical protein
MTGGCRFLFPLLQVWVYSALKTLLKEVRKYLVFLQITDEIVPVYAYFQNQTPIDMHPVDPFPVQLHFLHKTPEQLLSL